MSKTSCKNPRQGSWQNTTNKINLTLSEYNTFKKYFSGITQIKEAYLYFMENGSRGINGRGFYDLLSGDFSKEFNKNLYEPSQEQRNKNNKKGVILKFLNNNLPRPDVKAQDIKPTRGHDKNWNKVLNNIKNIKSKPLVLNLHSEVGEQALLASSLLVKTLQDKTLGDKTLQDKSDKSKQIKVVSESGIDLNSKVLNFEDKDESNISKLVNKADVFVIYSYNSFMNKDYRKQALDSLFDYCHEQEIPIILSNKKELKSKERQIINIKFSDEYKNEVQLISDIFGEG